MSFRLKTILGIGFIQTVLLMLMIIMIVNFVEDSKNRELKERATTTINMFTATTRDALLSSDLATLTSSSKELLENPGIIYAIILDSNQQIMANAGNTRHFNNSFKEDTNLNQAMSDHIFDISKKIEIDGFELGSIQLGISTDNVINNINDIRNYSIGIATIVIFIMLILSYILGSLLTRRLTALEEAAIKLGEGKLGLQVTIKGNDEIARTARSFNDMSHKLKQTEAHRQIIMTQLEIAEEKSRLLLTSAADGIFGVNPQHIVEFANPTCTHLLELSNIEITGRIFDELCSDNHSLLENIDNCITHGNVITETDTVLRTHLGNTIHVDYTCAPIKKGNTISGAVVIFNDISKRIEAEIALREAHKLALDNAQAKADFMANTSHEIRTPIHGIIGLLQLIDKNKLPDDYAEYIKIAEQSVNRLTEVINDILDFSRIDSGKITLANIDFNLYQSLNECMEMYFNKAQNKQLQLKLDYSDKDTWLKGDPEKLQKILSRLIDNAIKFTQQGSIHIDARILAHNADSTHIEIRVQDTGIGIPKAKQDSLFDSFRQGDGSTTRAYGGIGLGLATVKRLLDRMGGEIHVESTENQGSQFIFDLRFQNSHVYEQSD